MGKRGRYYYVQPIPRKVSLAAGGGTGGAGERLFRRRAFATSVAVILPLCVLSAAIYLARGRLDVMAALPYLLGGTLGGWLGGRWFQKTRVDWLRRLFGALLIWGGVRCLL